MDRISQLPIEILHQILSLLPTKTAARTAVLSKPWLKACYTNSSLCFDESDFGKEGRNNGKFLDFHGKFSRLVDNTLERYRRDICYTEFYLSRHNLDICLRTIEIGTCQNLRRVEFVNAEIDDTVLFKLIPKLHLIKELILHYCKCLKKIKIASSTLEVCSIECCKYLVQATFDVPNLLSLVVKPMQNFDKRTRLPSLSFASASSQCRISIKYGDLPSDVEHIIDLRRYLVELNDKVVDLTLGSVYKGLKAARGIDHLPAPVNEYVIECKLSEHHHK